MSIFHCIHNTCISAYGSAGPRLPSQRASTPNRSCFFVVGLNKLKNVKWCKIPWRSYAINETQRTRHILEGSVPITMTSYWAWWRLKSPAPRLFKRFSRRRSKKTLRVTGLCEGNSPVTGGFHAQRPAMFPFYDVIMPWLFELTSDGIKRKFVILHINQHYDHEAFVLMIDLMCVRG